MRYYLQEKAGIEYMLSWISELIERKRAQTFVNSLPEWYQTCNEVSRLIGDALHDEAVTQQDIGTVIDKADRLLMKLGFCIPEAKGLIRRRNPDLARRFENTSQQAFRLRNETTRFLIRSQGPQVTQYTEADRDIRLVYYYRALEEVGFKARQIKREFDRDLKSVWGELQVLLVQTERMLASQA
jgi:hypothetical protein